jgi:hypothetical protein
MRLLSLLSVLPLAAAAPTDGGSNSPPALTVPNDIVPQNVRVVGVSLLGSGCPAGTADVQIDATKTLMEVTFSEYIVETGPDTRASDWRKNCKLTLNLEFDEGFQSVTPCFSSSSSPPPPFPTFPQSRSRRTYVDSLTEDPNAGRAGRFATLTTDMSGFAEIPAGVRGQCTNTFDFTGISGQSSYSVELKGEVEGPFTLKADPDVVSWSPCGGTTAIMNMNTQCNIFPTKEEALIAVCVFFPPFPFLFSSSPPFSSILDSRYS